ncbi:hypothetical protein AB1L42_18520 [Thalassoglobus sp. JC818]
MKHADESLSGQVAFRPEGGDTANTQCPLKVELSRNPIVRFAGALKLME